MLAGQHELADRLNEPALRQLKQRVALRCEIAPFQLAESAAYIAMRIRTAGGEASRLFTREAVMLIHEHSRGIPRIISVICDNALLSGMALGRRPVDREIVLEVCKDFDLSARTDRTEWGAQERTKMLHEDGSGDADTEPGPQPDREDGPVANAEPSVRRFTLGLRGR